MSFGRFCVVDCAESTNFDKIKQILLPRFLKNLAEKSMMGGSAGFPPSGAGRVFLIRLVVVPFVLWYHQAKGRCSVSRSFARACFLSSSNSTAVDGRGRGL